MRIAVGSDHAGFEYKQLLADYLRRLGHEVEDLGCPGPEPCDYPDYGRAVAVAVAGGQAERGLLVCGSAVGVSVVANKIPGIRAAICHDPWSAHQAVTHDDLNVLCLGQRVIGVEVAKLICKTFFAAAFEPSARHERRVAKLNAIDAAYRRAPGWSPGGGDDQ